MKIATYNVNGVNARLPVLLRWLEQTQPDVVCLQELKAPEENFPIEAIQNAGYGESGMGRRVGIGLPSSRAAASLRKYGAVCRAILMTYIADISKR